MSAATSEYEHLRGRLRAARDEASAYRNANRIATCGLAMEYGHDHDHRGNQNWVNHGTYRVPHHIALRVADQYLVWATEYDVIADQIKQEMDAMFAAPSQSDRS